MEAAADDPDSKFGAQPERPASLLEAISRLPPDVASFIIRLCKCVSLTDKDEQKVVKSVTDRETCACLLDLNGQFARSLPIIPRHSLGDGTSTDATQLERSCRTSMSASETTSLEVPSTQPYVCLWRSPSSNHTRCRASTTPYLCTRAL